MAELEKKRVVIRVLLRDFPKKEKILDENLKGDYDILKDLVDSLPEGFSVSRHLRERMRSNKDAIYKRVLKLVKDGDARLSIESAKVKKMCIFDLTHDTKAILNEMTNRLAEDTGKGKASTVFRGIIFDFLDNPEPPAGRGRPLQNPVSFTEKFGGKEKRAAFSFYIRKVFRTAGEHGKDIKTFDAIENIVKLQDITKSEFYSRAIHNFSGQILFEPASIEREQIIIHISESADRRIKELADKANFDRLKPYQDGRIRNANWYPPEEVENVISHSHSMFNKRRAAKADVVRAAIYEELAQTIDNHSASARRGD